MGYSEAMAEARGFEPLRPVKACHISNVVHSTTLPRLHYILNTIILIEKNKLYKKRRDKSRLYNIIIFRSLFFSLFHFINLIFSLNLGFLFDTFRAFLYFRALRVLLRFFCYDFIVNFLYHFFTFFIFSNFS